jgi:Helix-turn-helix domain
MSEEGLGAVIERLERIEAALTLLASRQARKEWYTTEELAAIVGRSEYTVRMWCLNNRLRAEKAAGGRGKHRSWVISHQELLRFQREGLLARGRSPGHEAG